MQKTMLETIFLLNFQWSFLFQRTDNLIINIDSKVSCCNYKISCLHFLLSKKGISLKNQLSVVLAAALPHPYPACAKTINWLVAEAALTASEIFFVRDLLLVCLGRGFTDWFEKTNFVMTWISIFCCYCLIPWKVVAYILSCCKIPLSFQRRIWKF